MADDKTHFTEGQQVVHAVTSCSRFAVAGLLSGVFVLAVAGTASATWPPSEGSQGNTKQSGSSNAGTLVSRVTYSGSVRSSGSDATVQPVIDWTPPACWYEPRSVAEFKDYVETMYTDTINTPGQANYAKAAVGQFRDIYKDGKYKNYNEDKADEGNWWVAVQNPDRMDDPASWECSDLPFWVANNDDPGVPQAVTPKILAEAAYDAIQLPGTKVTLAPANVTKVNLSTWAWLDKATFKEVSVTASLNVGGLNIQATTTAKPVSLKLEPGTSDAETYPTSGVCTLNADKSIGEPYAKGKADQTPPCGIKYLRSSGSGSFQLKATITWQITWSGTGDPGGNLPSGTFGTTQDVKVQEVQAVNR
ncbi:hypothetical protein [Streptomyces sp. Ag109_O5-10]|uniref:hypothetical protein n=1 Tax=Streptomyces sp. Ag109_O5-10 TaxID=1855349 RepID=UPI000894E4F3|nr:hypothetical protein [Streptomyces sp. Ag109_O5-10]SEE77324.1 hypothetical protein SAMN05216533_3631 [Streptomyces sp. Ag109_O5-10]